MTETTLPPKFTLPKLSTKLVNTIIGVAIMLLGPLFTAPEFSFPAAERLINMGFPVVDGNALVSFSDAGWTAAIIFIGLVYLWITVDTFWPSLFGMIVITLNPYYPMPAVLAQYLGNPMTFNILFLTIFLAAIIKSQIINYVANYLLTRNFLKGRPWILLGTLMVASYFGALIDAVAIVFLLWPVCYFILEEIGCKPGDKLSTFMVGNIIAGMIFGISTDIIKGPVLFMTSGFTAFVTQNPHLNLPQINIASWLLMAFIISMCIILVILFAMRFIFRVDVEGLRNFDTEKLKRNPLPPMNWKQKTLIYLFSGYIVYMLLPNFLPASFALTGFLRQNAMFGTFILFTAIMTIRYKGEPLAKMTDIAPVVPWNLFFLLAITFYIGGLLTNPSTNIPIILELSIANALQGLDYLSFLLLTILFAMIVTNLLNSVVSAIILAPVIATVSLSYGFVTMPIVALFVYAISSALLTPAAGVPAALMYGNKDWLPGNAAPFYAVFFTTIISIVILVVAIPLARILF